MKAGIDFIGVGTPFYCTDGKGKFLFHKRSNNTRDEQGAWDTGSGQLEFGQTLEESVLREVREEYGCEGRILEQLPAHSIFRVHDGMKTHWVITPFFILVNPKQVKINEPHKIDEIGWFTLDKLPTPLHTGFQHTFHTFRSYFKKYE